MQRRPRGFAISWFFAPYLGSADLDLFKRLKDTDVHYDVVQVKRDQKDDRILNYITEATFERFEVTTDHRNPRTRKVRDDFEAAALELFKKRRSSYDFILSHSNEVPSHAVAFKIKEQAPELPWIAYFGDVVSTNPYVRHIGNYPLHDEDIETEARTLEHADLVICNNEYQKKLMFSGPLEKFATKAVVIPHCYDPAMFPRASRARNERFTFMHVGTLYHVKRTAEPLLRAVDRLLEIYPEYRNRFEVVFYGGPYYANDLTTHAYMRHRSHVRLEESVPYMESLRLMQTADVLVAIDGIFTREDDNLDFNPFFPGKLTDYMGANKPIMAITMPRGPTTDVLHASGNLTADLRLDRIAYVLKRYLDKKVPHDATPFARFDCAVVSVEMEAALKAAMSGRSAIRDLQRMLDEKRALPTGTAAKPMPGNGATQLASTSMPLLPARVDRKPAKRASRTGGKRA